MKRIILVILILSVLLLTGCNIEKREDAWAVVEMPDGSIMEGYCTKVHSGKDGSVTLVISGAEFRVGWSRVVIMWPEN